MTVLRLQWLARHTPVPGREAGEWDRLYRLPPDLWWRAPGRRGDRCAQELWFWLAAGRGAAGLLCTMARD